MGYKDVITRMPVTAKINDFDEWSVRALKWSIAEAIYNNQKILPIIIDSYGGEVYSLLAMMDMIKASGLEIITISTGKTMSCGSVLLTAGNKRYCTENSTIMIHNAWTVTGGNVDELKASSDELNRLNNKLFSYLDNTAQKPTGFFKNLIKQNGNADLYLTPEQALNYGLITNIGVPKVIDIFGSDINKIFTSEEILSGEAAKNKEKTILMSLKSEKNKENQEIEENNFKARLKVIEEVFSIKKESQEILSKNTENNIKMEEKPKMDLKAVLAKLTEEEKNLVLALENEKMTLTSEVKSLKASLIDKDNEIKAKNQEIANIILENNKKEDEGFLNSLLKDRKILNKDKELHLKILSTLPGDLKKDYKEKLEASKEVYEGEINDQGEKDFNLNSSSAQVTQMKLKKIAEQKNLNLSKPEDLSFAMEYALKNGL